MCTSTLSTLCVKKTLWRASRHQEAPRPEPGTLDSDRVGTAHPLIPAPSFGRCAWNTAIMRVLWAPCSRCIRRSISGASPGKRNLEGGRPDAGVNVSAAFRKVLQRYLADTKRFPLGPHTRNMPRALWWFWEGGLSLMSEVIPVL